MKSHDKLNKKWLKETWGRKHGGYTDCRSSFILPQYRLSQCSCNKAFLFSQVWYVDMQNLYKVLMWKQGMSWEFCLCCASCFTSLPAPLPYTDSPPPRWSPAHLCGWPVWLNSAPHTWSHTGTPHGCQEHWCAWCHYSPAPPWCSLGRARSSSPEPGEEVEENSTICRTIDWGGSGIVVGSKTG